MSLGSVNVKNYISTYRVFVQLHQNGRVTQKPPAPYLFVLSFLPLRVLFC